MKYKVLLDGNIILSSSIYFVGKDIGFNLKHRDYDESKTLINYFKKNIDKKEGIYTKTIGNSCISNLGNAVLSTIEEQKNTGKIKEEPAVLKSFSVIYSECLRRMEENKEYLVRETVNEKEVKLIIGKVLVFYTYKLKGMINKMDPQEKIDNMLSKASFKGKMGRMFRYVNIENIKKESPFFRILKRKFIDSYPNQGDFELLSQAAYFNKIYAKDKVVCILCSKDHHFVAIKIGNEIEDVVPLNIEKEFGISCLSPKDVMKKLKG